MGLKWFSEVGPFAGMAMVNLSQVTYMIVLKAAMSQGMDKYVIILYSNTLSSLLFNLCSIIFHRSASSRPPLTFNIICGFVSISVLGIVGQICGIAGIQYSSPTLGTAVLNITPAFTFIFAIIFRMEKLDWRSSSSQAKLVGTIMSIGGAFVVTLYKGPPMMKTKTSSLSYSSSHQLVPYPQQQSSWIFGGILSAAEAMIISVVYIVQALVLSKYTAPLLVLSYTLSFSTILSSICCLIAVEDQSSWRLRLDMGLAAILCAASALWIGAGLSLWCLWKTGPLYVSMFKPLAIIFSAVMSAVFLGDVLCVGSVIGSVIIVMGFYVVMWGKAKEKQLETENEVECLVSESSSVPLLQNKIEDCNAHS